MLPGRLINRLKLSHKSLCHWLLCFDCILLVRWWCQVRTIIMLVMYFVIASAWCIMEATMHTEYFSGQRLSMDPFLTLKFILFYSVKGSPFYCKKLNQFCLLTFPTKYPQKLLCHNFPNLILILTILCYSLFLFLFLFSPGGTSVTHGWWTQPTSFIRSRVSS